MKKCNKSNTRRAGFTLVEIMVVVAIIGVLAAIAVPIFNKARAQSVASTELANAKIVLSAYEAWANDNPALASVELSSTEAGVNGGVAAYIRGGTDSLEVSGQTATWPTTVGAFDDVSPKALHDVMYPASPTQNN